MSRTQNTTMVKQTIESAYLKYVNVKACSPACTKMQVEITFSQNQTNVFDHVLI